MQEDCDLTNSSSCPNKIIKTSHYFKSSLKRSLRLKILKMQTFETYQEKTSSNLTVGLTVGIVAFAIFTGLGIIYWRKYRAKTMGVCEENSPSVPEIALPGVVSTKNMRIFLSLSPS